jgi:hypothetical protein
MRVENRESRGYGTVSSFGGREESEHGHEPVNESLKTPSVE